MRALMEVHLIMFFLLLGSFGDQRSEAQQKTLDPQEVDVLRKVASKLQVEFWDFNVDPCNETGAGQWFVNTSDKNGPKRQVACGNCNETTVTNICHVVSIQLKSQNLTGVLPEELANLKSLAQIILSRNYINGSIPPTWGSLPLVNLSLIGNRLTGEIPDEIGNIKTLSVLLLDNNLFEGRLPSALGNLANLTRLLLSANNFTGELPETLGKLGNLEDFRIDGNAISGKIPSFIGNWTKLGRLDMQGTSLEGPFPDSFATLENLTELRVTDFKGNGSFPPLQNMNLNYLILRNCSISGQIPDFIGKMSNLKRLDLSFNNFSGQIPSTFENELALNLYYMYLTNNKLNGTLPRWIWDIDKPLDVSYNSFTGIPQSLTCQKDLVNLLSSYSSSEDNSIPSCFRKNFPCSGKPKNYQLFINCGGKAVTVDNHEYDADNNSQLARSTFYIPVDKRWAFSSTGHFVGNDKSAKYVTGNTSVLDMTNPELYMSARLSPMSLKYYGLCLQKGNYNVSLYFAEIVFTNDQTFSSVGRRIFDVSIQGTKVLSDFNIAEAANGTGRPTVKSFNVSVDSGTLEIHFQWLGKGTNAIPARGVYGPLISAISVTPNFKPDLGESKLSTGIIVGIVACCLFVLLIMLAILFYLRKKNKENIGLDGLDLQTGYFSLRQIKSATRNFDPKNKIGEGGFGPVYKGVLPDGSVIAVKQLSAKSKQGNREFVNEVGMISGLQHPNLVKLFGCCIEGRQLFLIYEYLENNSLARALFVFTGPEGVKLNLDWQTRCKICLGIARGLAYLHEESVLKIVHRDIKATNVLLDKDLNAKISDFGLAKLVEEENTHITTRIAGTMGYMAPEYAMRGYLTDKADVYSFGVVVLELVSGKSNTNYRPKEEFLYLLDWAYILQEQGNMLELVDPCLGSNYSKREAQQMLDLSLLCTSQSPTLRPQMSMVVSMLDGQTPIIAPSTREDNRSASDDVRLTDFETLSQDGQFMGLSIDALWSTSSKAYTSSKEKLLDVSESQPLKHE